MGKGFEMIPPRMGSERLPEKAAAPDTEKPESGSQILASGLVRGLGKALGPCASWTRDREMAKDFL